MLTADEAGTYLGDNQVYIDYSSLGFGDKVVLNSKILVTKGTLLSGEFAPSLPLYTIIGTTDNTSSRFAITIEYNYPGSPSAANEISTDPTQLHHILIEIVDVGQTAGLSFTQDLMDTQTYRSDNTATFTLTAIDSDDHTLPVALTSFTVFYRELEQNIELQWQTASEADVAGFNVYCADTDDVSTAIIINHSLIAAAGSTAEPQNYSFCDVDGDIYTAHYYWLEIVNSNGVTSLHNSILYTPEQENPEIEEILTTKLIGSFPNPVAHTSEISFQIKGSAMEQNTVISVYNVRGELVKTVYGTNGVAVLDTSDISQGIYFYKMQTDGFCQIKKLVVVK